MQREVKIHPYQLSLRASQNEKIKNPITNAKISKINIKILSRGQTLDKELKFYRVHTTQVLW